MVKQYRRPIAPRSWDDLPLLLELKEAAQIVGYTPERLMILAKAPDPEQRFPAGKIGKKWIVEKFALMEYLDSRGISLAGGDRQEGGINGK